MSLISTSLHSFLISCYALITSSLFYRVLKQNYENCSGKLWGGIDIIPKNGVNLAGGLGGSFKLPVISSFPFSFKCLSKTILFIVLANSKLTSLRRVVVSDELLPLRALVF